MNDDGLIDLIVGERSGYIKYFSKNQNNTLNPGINVKTLNGDIVYGDYSSPEICDWNGDNFPDIILGKRGTESDKAQLRLYLNSGNDSELIFNEFTVIKAENETIEGKLLHAEIADLNGDGKKDLVLTNGTLDKNDRGIMGFYYYENISNSETMELKKPVLLKLGSDSLFSIYSNCGIAVGDLNGDNIIDIGRVEGGSDSLFIHYGIQSVKTAIPEVIIKKDYKITYNRFTKSLYVKLPCSDSEFKLNIFSINGKLLLTKRFYSNKGTIKIKPKNNLSGIYLVKCTFKESSFVKKIRVY